MKKFLITLSILLSWFHKGTLAQNISCADFSIVAINPSPGVAGEYMISILFAASSNSFVSYPYVSALLDSHGDTLAKGQLNYFGQIGGTTQDYPVSLTAGMIGATFTAIFIQNNDTCLLSFPSASAIADVNTKKGLISIGPNPISNHINIVVDDNFIGEGYQVTNSLGQVVMNGKIHSKSTKIELGQVARGMYLFSIGGDKKNTFKIVKE